MSAEWYLLFNKTEFEATGLVARKLTLTLESRGRLQFLVTKGNELGITFGDEFLPVDFLEMNPYIKDGYATYLADDGGVWFGFEVDEA